MALKRTEIERLKAAHLKNRMRQSPVPERFGAGSSAGADRRERRRLERERGLVPFAVKLDGELVKQLRSLAHERKQDLTDVVTDLLKKGLHS